MSEEPKLVHVYAATDGTDAHLLKGFLEDQGIEVFLDHEESSEMLAFPNDPSIAPTLSVREEQVEAARKIVREYEARGWGPDEDDDSEEE